MTLKSRGRVASHIFVKKTEESSEKTLKYVNCAHVMISGPSQE